MESNWRANREIFGWGGKVYWPGVIPFAGTLAYLFEVDPPVSRGSYLMTHCAVSRSDPFPPMFLGGRLLSGCFNPLEANTSGILNKPWLHFPVKPD